jgi:hypothetical protein
VFGTPPIDSEVLRSILVPEAGYLEVFHGFPQSFQADFGIAPYCFLLTSLIIIIHHPVLLVRLKKPTGNELRRIDVPGKIRTMNL